MTRLSDGKKGKLRKYVARLTAEEAEILRQATTGSEENFTHDKFIYVIWSIIAFARSFFRRFLPPEILKNVKLETLRRFPTKMVDRNGKETEGDLFYLVDTIDGDGMLLVILLEHKSGSARDVALQTLGYEVDMMKKITLEPSVYKNAEGRYPAPFTIVLAQYDVPQLDDLFYWVEGTRQFGPFFKFHLVNLQKENFDDVMDDEPMLYVAMALSRLAYRIKGKKWNDARDSELKEVFIAALNRDPSVPSNFPYFLEVLMRYTSWFTENSGFNLQKFTENLMQSLPVQNRKPFKSFLSQLFSDQMPEYYRNLEAKYEDCYGQLAQKDEQLAQKDRQITKKDEQLTRKNKQIARKDEQLIRKDEQLTRKDEQLTRKDKQIAKLNSDKEASSLQRSILLGASERFNVPFPTSITQRLFSITNISTLSQIYEVLQTRSSLEDFESDFDRLAVGD